MCKQTGIIQSFHHLLHNWGKNSLKLIHRHSQVPSGCFTCLPNASRSPHRADRTSLDAARHHFQPDQRGGSQCFYEREPAAIDGLTWNFEWTKSTGETDREREMEGWREGVFLIGITRFSLGMNTRVSSPAEPPSHSLPSCRLVSSYRRSCAEVSVFNRKRIRFFSSREYWCPVKVQCGLFSFSKVQ